MSTTHEGFSLLLSFEQLAHQSAWLRSRFAQAQKPVQAVLDEWKAKPFCDTSISRTRIELAIALEAAEREASEALLMALLTFAAEKGAHAEFARFPLDGAVRCQVWDARKQRFIERPPDAREVKQDYAHVQKALRELVRIKAPKTAAPSAPALSCPCGAPVKASAPRCPSCQRSFAEPLAVKSAPGDAVAVRLARERLDEQGIASEGKDFGSFALVRPRNAGEWLGARDVLTRSGFTLLDSEELDRRVKFLADVASWPRTYPVGEGDNTLEVWTYHLLNTDSAGKRATLEKLGRAHPETLLTLARGLPPSDPGWLAAAHLAGVALGALTGDHAQSVVRRTYARWLEESGHTKREGLQLGGHPHGFYTEDPRIRLSCRHTPTLLQFKPLAFGMTLPASRVATSVCLNPKCERPGVTDLVTA